MILRGPNGKSLSLAKIQKSMISKNEQYYPIDKLIEKDCVVRESNSKNKRKVDISITATGLDLLDKTNHVMLEIENNLIFNLNEKEKSKLIRLLGMVRLIAN